MNPFSKGIDELDIIFDSSLSSIDESMSFEEYRSFLVSSLELLLKNRFPDNPQRQKIIVHKERITISCPICGDSMHSDFKKRGNIILKTKWSGYYKCFNCGAFKRVDLLFRDFKINMKLGAINYMANNISDFSRSSNIKYDISAFLDNDKIERFSIDRSEITSHLNLQEAKNSSIFTWLTKRLQTDWSKFLYDNSSNCLFILNLTKSGRVLGFQKRLFKGNNKYLTYNTSKIYELMGRDPKEVPEDINMLSQLFNICLVDYSKPVTLFEGPFDAFLFDNGIANTGANKVFPLDLYVRYFYDSDETGIRRSIEQINEGSEVFLWTKFLTDNNIPYKKKFDLNDVLVWAKTNNVKLTNFNNYFSKDSLDIIDI